MKNLSEHALRGNIRIFEEWFIPSWGNGEASKNAKESVKRWKAELNRRGLPIKKQVRLNGLLEEVIKLQNSSNSDVRTGLKGKKNGVKES